MVARLPQILSAVSFSYFDVLLALIPCDRLRNNGGKLVEQSAAALIASHSTEANLVTQWEEMETKRNSF